MAADESNAPVTVFTTNDPAMLAVARSVLEGAGIEFFVAGQTVSGFFPGGAVGPYGAPEIRVAAENADDARALLRQLQPPG